MQVMRTKPIDDILAAGEQTGLRRRLGALDLASIGVGIVIGTGIFTLTGVAAQDQPDPPSPSRSRSPVGWRCSRR